MAETAGAALLFALSCNLDTLLLALSYSLRGNAPSRSAAAVLAAVTTLVTAIALGLGRLAAALTVLPRPGALGGLTLAGLGLWTVLDALRHPAGELHPVRQRRLTAAACVNLGAALAVNNAGAGVAAGLSGLPVLCGSLLSLLCTLLALWTGGRLAVPLSRTPWLERWSLPLSGVLLVVLGLVQLAGG